MPETPISQPSSNILAVVVLYNRDVLQSQSISSLFEILQQTPELARFYSLLVYDNSPESHSYGQHTALPFAYVHDPENGGLARAYNFALQRAEADGQTWLLLLDQDTSLTREFLLALLQAADSLQARHEVASIVPRLLVNGEIHSPAANFMTLLRRQFKPPAKGMGHEVAGIQEQHLCSYNSGSTLRVQAVRSIGGFPDQFWLDFLDHAVFHALFAGGYRTYVLQATLGHDFSHSAIESVPQWRSENVLRARTLYVLRWGTGMERLLYRLLRHARKLWQSDKSKSIWKQTALRALRLKVPEERYGRRAGGR